VVRRRLLDSARRQGFFLFGRPMAFVDSGSTAIVASTDGCNTRHAKPRRRPGSVGGLHIGRGPARYTRLAD
jgi:hypothetical protein